MTNAAHIIFLSSASAMLLAAGYIPGRWHQGRLREATRDALTCDGTNWYECCRSAN